MAAPMRQFSYRIHCKKLKSFLPVTVKSSFSTRASSFGSKEYDLAVIGGGSGGLACSKEASSFDKKVVVLDYVKPSPKGSQWGLGGTCVNAGCIPKKLMHQASLLGQALEDAVHYGWQVPANPNHSWVSMVEAVQNCIKSLNWGHRVALRDKKVEYLNAKGSFVDEHTIKAVLPDGQERLLTAQNIVLATGMRPRYPVDIPGALEHAITSDDIFSLARSPGRTLVVGGSYVALECAGFLKGLALPTTVMVRSICLRGFDQQMAGLVTDHMQQEKGIDFLWKCTPTSLVREPDGTISVTWSDADGNRQTSSFDTVLFAMGRYPQTSNLGLENTSVKLHPNGKIVGVYEEQSTVPNIYAIGDILEGCNELTPVAIQAGKLLARRLFGGSSEVMNYDQIATTVFTPLEYASVGLAEEDAIQQHGEDRIEVYHSFYQPVEYSVPERSSSQCYLKVVCFREGDQSIIGVHIVGPNAGEMLQGMSVAIRCGVTYKQLSSTVGIHPTVAEEFVKLHITKRSGVNPVLTSC